MTAPNRLRESIRIHRKFITSLIREDELGERVPDNMGNYKPALDIFDAEVVRILAGRAVAEGEAEDW